MGRVRAGFVQVCSASAVLVAIVAAAPRASADAPLPPPRRVTSSVDGPVASPAPASAAAPLAIRVAPPPPPASSPPAASPDPVPSPRFPDAPRQVASIPEAVPVVAPKTTRLTAVVTRFFPADLDGSRGTMSLTRGLFELEGTIPMSSRFTWKWGAQAEMDVYDFSDVDRVVPGTGRLLEEAYLLRAGPGIEWTISDRWSMTLGVFAQSAIVSGVALDNTLSFGGVGTVRVRVADQLGLRFGAMVGTNLDGSTYLIPIASVDGGDAKGPAGPVRFSVRGSGCRVGYTFSPALSVGVAARYDAREWRLAPDDRVPQGYFDDTRVQLGVDVQWTFRKAWTLGLEIGADVYHEIGIDDRDGNRVTVFEADPAPYAALSLTWML